MKSNCDTGPLWLNTNQHHGNVCYDLVMCYDACNNIQIEADHGKQNTKEK